MSETLKATIVGTIIIGIFMLISARMVTTTAWDMLRTARAYVEAQKVEAKGIVKREKAKVKELALELADEVSEK